MSSKQLDCVAKKYRWNSDMVDSDYSDYSDSDASYASDGGGDYRLHDDPCTPSSIQDAIATNMAHVSMAIVIVDKKDALPFNAVASMHTKRGSIGHGEKYPPLRFFSPSFTYDDVPHLTMFAWIEEAVQLYPSRGVEKSRSVKRLRGSHLNIKMDQWVSEHIRELDETQGKMIIPFRAETRIATPTPKDTSSPGKAIVNAARSLLKNYEPGDALKAPMLKEYLDKMYPNHRDTLWGIPIENSFMGIRFNKERVRFGCPTPTSRRCADELTLGVSAPRGLPKWILLCNADYWEIVNLIPPWFAYESGTWEFYLYVDHSDTTPVVSHPRNSIRTKPFLSYYNIREKERSDFNINKKCKLDESESRARAETEDDYRFALNDGLYRQTTLTKEEQDDMKWYQDEWGKETRDKEESRLPFVSKLPVPLLINYPAQHGVWPCNHPT